MLHPPRQAAATLATRAVLTLLHGIGAVWGHMLFIGRSNGARITRLNLGLAFPELNARQQRRLTYTSLRESGKLMFELALFWSWPAGLFVRAVTEVRGEHLIRRARAAGKGVIMISPHLGNWEVLNIPFVDYSMAAVYKPVSSFWLDRWVRRGRERYGGRTIPLTTRGIRALRQHLDRQGVVLVLPDQVPGPEAGRVRAAFFGTPAWSGTLVPRLIQRCNVEVILGYVRRLPRGRGFRVELEPAPDEVYSSDVQRSAAAINAGMERLIRRSPEQYLWEYKRYKNTVYPQLYDRPRPYRHR